MVVRGLCECAWLCVVVRGCAWSCVVVHGWEICQFCNNYTLYWNVY